MRPGSSMEIVVPKLDAQAPVGAEFSVRGWATGGGGIVSVQVEVEGAWSGEALVLPLAPDLAAQLTASEVEEGASFYLHLDANDWEPGWRGLNVTALTAGGHMLERSGRVLVDPDLAYRRWFQARGTVRSTKERLPATADRDGSFGFVLGVIGTEDLDSASAAPTLDSIGRQQLRASRTLVETSKNPAPGAVSAQEVLDSALAATANGEVSFAVILNSGAILAPGALGHIAAAMGAPEPPDLLYADEDSLDEHGRRGRPRFKPGWSPELLLERDYVGPLVALRPRAAASLHERAGDMATIYELLVALIDADITAERIPMVLCTTLAPRSELPDERGRAAVESLAGERGVEVIVEPRPELQLQRVDWTIEGSPRVSIVIPTSGRDRRLLACVKSLASTTWADIEVVLVHGDGDLVGPAAEALGEIPHTLVEAHAPFNFSDECNRGAAAATGSHLLFLNDDVEVVAREWIERMLEYAQRPSIGIVGALLLYPGGLIQHAGVLVPPSPASPHHLLVTLDPESTGPSSPLHPVRNCAAVTGACLLISEDVFTQLGGFDSELALEAGDLDLCLRALDAGMRVVLTPRAVLVHHEKSTRGQRVGWADIERFHAAQVERGWSEDPYFHPALDPFLERL